MKYLFLLLLSFSAFANEFYYLPEEELNPEAQEVLIKKPEKYQRHESMVYDFNSTLGIKDQRQYTGGDKNRLSFSGHVSGAYEHLTDIVGFEAQYFRRSTRYDQIWWGAQLYRMDAQFDSVTQNHTGSSVDADADPNQVRPGDAKTAILGFGPGVSYRFKLLLDFWPTEDWFENIDVFANYIVFQDKHIGQDYKGYGLTTSYGLHKRTQTSFYYGGKFSYNLASVTRAAIGNESTTNRSFSLGWLSLGFEVGFFY